MLIAVLVGSEANLGPLWAYLFWDRAERFLVLRWRGCWLQENSK